MKSEIGKLTGLPFGQGVRVTRSLVGPTMSVVRLWDCQGFFPVCLPCAAGSHFTYLSCWTLVHCGGSCSFPALPFMARLVYIIHVRQDAVSELWCHHLLFKGPLFSMLCLCVVSDLFVRAPVYYLPVWRPSWFLIPGLFLTLLFTLFLIPARLTIRFGSWLGSSDYQLWSWFLACYLTCGLLLFFAINKGVIIFALLVSVWFLAPWQRWCNEYVLFSLW